MQHAYNCATYKYCQIRESYIIAAQIDNHHGNNGHENNGDGEQRLVETRNKVGAHYISYFAFHWYCLVPFIWCLLLSS
jgi:hypothetical protein